MIAVLGPGGVGGFVAAALTRAGDDVVVVAREDTAAAISRVGVVVESVRLGDFSAHPRAVGVLAERPSVLFVAPKATALEASLERIQTTPGIVVPLLNGLDHMAVLRRRFEHVTAGSIRIEAERPSPGRVVQTSPFLRIDLAADDASLGPALAELAATLERAGIPASIGPGEAQILWSKLVRLNALALTTSASGEPIGFIRTNPEWRAALVGCIHEGAEVANADGAVIDPAIPLGELDDAHAELRSSMYRDILAGRTPELDAIAGAVLRAGARHRIACPTVARLAGLVAERAAVGVPGV